MGQKQGLGGGGGGATWPLLAGRDDASFFAPVHPMALDL